MITYWNKAAENISGFTAKEVVGRSCLNNILIHVDSNGNSLCAGKCLLAATIEDGTVREAEVYMHRISPLTDNNGDLIGGIELLTDISHQAVNELKIKELEKPVVIQISCQIHYFNKDTYFSYKFSCICL